MKLHHLLVTQKTQYGGYSNMAYITKGSVPIGGIIPWLKSFTNTPPKLPSEFVECNGQVLSDLLSPYNGQTIPNLNGASAGTKRFLRGSETSGSTGGSETHSHTIASTTSSVTTTAGSTTITNTVTSPTGTESTLPSYYEVVYILRVR